jgi:5'-3' exonuclease
MDPLLYSQFQPLEDALRALGVVVWPMVEFEADDALAAAAAMAASDPRVEQVVVCSPDKDLAQCVRGDRIVQLDRRTREVRNEAGVRQKFGVGPASIPDWLALVGDSADGYPGLPGWGPSSSATVLARYHHLEHIPPQARDWDVPLRGSMRLAATLGAQRERALLFRTLAVLRTDAPIDANVDALHWQGPRAAFAAWATRLGAPELHERAVQLARAGAAPGADEADLA